MSQHEKPTHATTGPTACSSKLPATLRLGAVHLTVTDLDRSVALYEKAIGLRLHRREDSLAVMGAGEEDLLVLYEEPGARRAGRHAGLYHFALLFPSREELARAALRLAATKTPIQGASDHGTHEAIYLPDPDGNGIELAADRPRAVAQAAGIHRRPTSAGFGRPARRNHWRGATRQGRSWARDRPRAPARRRSGPWARLLPRRAWLRAHDVHARCRGVRVRRRLPSSPRLPPRLQHLARRGRTTRPGGQGRSAPLDRHARLPGGD